MVSVKDILDKIKSTIRGMMDEVAKLLDFVSNGFIEAWHISMLSLLGHVVILFALTEDMLIEAGILLIGFGLLDALDGAVARHQGTTGFKGMLLDSTTDRIKESLLYAGIAYWFANHGDPLGALYATLALGLSISVSYVKAKGEVALAEANAKRKKADINREFEDGIFGYEVRMFVLIVAFFTGQLLWGVLVVAIGSMATYLIRFSSILARLNDKD